MKRLIALFLSVLMLLALPLTASAEFLPLKPGEGSADGGDVDIGDLGGWENPFSDVTDTHWFFDAVKFNARYGLIKGTTSSTFSPAMPLSRSMLATILWRAYDEPSAPEDAQPLPFKDLVPNCWYTKALEWAYGIGMINGTSPTSFSPNASVTREDMTVMIYRLLDEPSDQLDATVLNDFSDKNMIATYATDAITFAVNSGLLQGSNGKLMPKGTTSRAEAATVMMRLMLLVNRSR